jgi:outer membrane protein assembly factor BamB
MARRRDSRLLIEIDLGSDGSGGGAPGGGAPVDGLPGRGPEGPAGRAPRRPSWLARVTAPARTRWLAVPRRTRVAVVAGTVAVVVVGTGGAVVLDSRAEAAHVAHMASLPGGVVDLSVPLEQTWEVETDTGVLALLDGGLLVAVAGTEVLAVDAATGEVAWRYELGSLIECGVGEAWARDLREPAASVTCLSGAPERTVTVFAADGELVGRRELGRLGPASFAYGERTGPFALVLADGAVAVSDAFDLEVDVLPSGEAVGIEALRAAGTPTVARLRVEDALTGEVRGQGEISLSTDADVAGCADGPDQITYTVGAWADDLGRGAGLSMCDQDVWVSADGTVGDAPSSHRVLAGGEQVVHTGTGSIVRTADGDEVELPGTVVDVEARDAGPAPFLVSVETGMAAFDQDGTRRWQLDGPLPEAGLFGVDGTFVVRMDDGELVAVDATTGERRWVRDGLFARDGEGDGEGFWSTFWLGTSALTDGEVGLLTTVSDGLSTRVVALDLADGATRWELDLEGAAHELLAVDAGVVVVDHGSSTAAMTTDGVTVWEASASLRGYAVP